LLRGELVVPNFLPFLQFVPVVRFFRHIQIRDSRLEEFVKIETLRCQKIDAGGLAQEPLIGDVPVDGSPKNVKIVRLLLESAICRFESAKSTVARFASTVNNYLNALIPYWITKKSLQFLRIFS
jgi:hypothetical protein